MVRACNILLYESDAEQKEYFSGAREQELPEPQ